MATVNKCDLCGDDAVDTVELKSKNTTPVICDVCDEHYVLFKKVKQMFTNQNQDEELKEKIKKLVLSEVG